MVRYDDGVMRMQRVKRKVQSVRNGRMDFKEDDFAGRPSTSKSDVQPARKDELVLENRRIVHFDRFIRCIIRKWRLLFVNSGKCKSPIFTVD
jgi:hypothetical protein